MNAFMYLLITFLKAFAAGQMLMPNFLKNLKKVKKLTEIVKKHEKAIVKKHEKAGKKRTQEAREKRQKVSK